MLQIIGRKGGREYRRAVRFCSERRIAFQEVDTKTHTLSKRELDSIFSSVDDPESVIDRDSAYYKKNGYAWREYDPREEVEEHPELLANPILRNREKACAGFSESFILENRE